MLSEVKALESAGKIPKRYNKIRHFTFYRNYYNAIKLLNERKSGEFIKAVCGYMFEETPPDFKDKTMQSYFNLCKMKLDLSKQRKSSGKVGGVKRKNVELTDGAKHTDASISENNREYKATVAPIITDDVKTDNIVVSDGFGAESVK